MGEIVRRKMTGYEPVAEWSADDPASYERAKEIFEQELSGGFIAVLSQDGRNEPIKELPRDAERVIITTAMGAG